MPDEVDALLAVVAHGLLNAAVPAVGAAAMLKREDLRPEVRDELVDMIQSRLEVVVNTLQDLVRGVPPEILEILDAMGTEAEI